MAWITRINLKSSSQAVRAEFNAFASSLIGEADLAENAFFYEKGCSLDHGNILISLLIVTVQEQFFTAQVHIVGSFAYDIGMGLRHEPHAIR